MTFLHLLIWQKVTYFAWHFQLCVLYCNRNYMKRLPSHRGSFNMQNMSVDSVFSYLTYEKWWHFYICQYGKKWLILPCIFSCVCCTATEIIWKDCSHREEAFDMQKMCVDCVFAYLTYEECNIFTSPNMAKSNLFCLAFSVVCVVQQQKLYEKIALTERNLLTCKTCV